MIEVIFKYRKIIGSGFFVADILYTILAIIYFSLVATSIMVPHIWFIIVSAVILGLNLIFAVACIVVKNLRKY